MYIYIDESGSFVPLDCERSRVATIAALVIPTANRNRLFDEFSILRKKFRPEAAELRGRDMGENETATVFQLLARYDVVVELCAIDIGMHRDQDVTACREAQAGKVVESLTPEHRPSLIAQVQGLAAMISKMPNQLFVQGFLMIILVQRVLETATNYYAQRRPAELSEYNWVVDAKSEDKITPGEEFWTQLMFPALQVLSEEEPVGVIPWGDYSYYARFQVAPEDLPDELRTPKRLAAKAPVANLSKLLKESFAFGPSHNDLGLQLVDIVANASARAFNQRLKEDGWLGLGRLMIRRNPQTLQMVTLRSEPGDKQRLTIRNYHGYVNETLQKYTRPMVPPKFRHLLRRER